MVQTAIVQVIHLVIQTAQTQVILIHLIQATLTAQIPVTLIAPVNLIVPVIQTLAQIPVIQTLVTLIAQILAIRTPAKLLKSKRTATSKNSSPQRPKVTIPLCRSSSIQRWYQDSFSFHTLRCSVHFPPQLLCTIKGNNNPLLKRFLFPCRYTKVTFTGRPPPFQPFFG